jgi:hypothetical protein
MLAQKATGPKVNTQQPDKVNVGDGSAVLGPDSSTGEGIESPSVNEQVEPLSQPGASGADTAMAGGGSDADPKSFGAPKPPADGHVQSGDDAPGTSHGDTDLGSDLATGENAETKSWDSESAGAYNNVRSK